MMMLPSAAGMPGMMTRNTITAPCSVKKLLYVSPATSCLPGAHSSVRTISANAPPTISAIRIAHRYIIPIRL